MAGLTGWGEEGTPASGAAVGYPANRPMPARRARALAVAAALTATGLLLAFLAAASLLLAALLPHGWLLVAVLMLLFAPVALVAVSTAALAWIGRRAWRSGAWLEVIPAAAGMPWLGRAAWLMRALLVGRALWRAGSRARRPPRRRRANAEYQADPDGPWRQVGVGGLSGTTR